MEEKEKKSKKNWVIILIISGLIVILAVSGYLFWHSYKDKADKNSHQSNSSDSTDQATATQGATSNNFDNKGEPSEAVSSPEVNSADPYSLYDAGKKLLNQKNYQGSLDYFNQALAIRNDDANFYISKSEAQVGLGQKQAAIDTINQGLTVLPNNETLLTQLDVLQNVVK